MSMPSIHDSQIPSPCAADREPVAPALQAHFRRMRELRPGLHLHADDAAESRDFTAQAQMNEALRFVLLLEGEVDLSYGARDVRLNAGAARRLCEKGQRGPEPGVDRAGLGRQGGPGAAFMADFGARALAEQIVRPPVLDSWMQNLYLESRTLELVAQAFAVLPGMQSSLADCADGAAAGLRPREHKRLREVRELLSGRRPTGSVWTTSHRSASDGGTAICRSDGARCRSGSGRHAPGCTQAPVRRRRSGRRPGALRAETCWRARRRPIGAAR